MALLHLPLGRTAEHVRAAFATQLTKLPTPQRRTLTWNEGKEMAEHVQSRVDPDIRVLLIC